MTAAELREIGNRISFDGVRGGVTTEAALDVAERDRARLYEAVERMLEERIMTTAGRCAYMDTSGDVHFCETKDAAIDALLQGGGK